MEPKQKVYINPESGFYNILYAKDDKFYLSIAGESKENDSQIEIQEFQNKPHQIFYIAFDQPTQSYFILPVLSMIFLWNQIGDGNLFMLIIRILC